MVHHLYLRPQLDLPALKHLDLHKHQAHLVVTPPQPHLQVATEAARSLLTLAALHLQHRLHSTLNPPRNHTVVEHTAHPTIRVTTPRSLVAVTSQCNAGTGTTKDLTVVARLRLGTPEEVPRGATRQRSSTTMAVVDTVEDTVEDTRAAMRRPSHKLSIKQQPRCVRRSYLILTSILIFRSD